MSMSTFSIRVRVTSDMTARFFDAAVHPLYATFAIVEHAEYVSRCVIRSRLPEGIDAIGSAVEIEHRGPARVGAVVTLEATVREWGERQVVCDVVVREGERTIAACVTTQHLLPRERITALYQKS